MCVPNFLCLLCYLSFFSSTLSSRWNFFPDTKVVHSIFILLVVVPKLLRKVSFTLSIPKLSIIFFPPERFSEKQTDETKPK